MQRLLFSDQLSLFVAENIEINKFCNSGHFYCNFPSVRVVVCRETNIRCHHRMSFYF